MSANPTKWTNTLKQFVGCYRRICWVCLTILWGWPLKGLTSVCIIAQSSYQGVKNLHFSQNLTCFVFLNHPFWDSLFCLITDMLVNFVNTALYVKTEYLKHCTNRINRLLKASIVTTNLHSKIYWIQMFWVFWTSVANFQKYPLYRLHQSFLFTITKTQ